MFNNGSELLKICQDKNLKISEVCINKEVNASELDRKTVLNKMKEVLDVMNASAHEALDKEVISVSGLTGGNSKKLNEYMKKNNTLSGNFLNLAMAKAFSTSEVNASMGKVVAAPTAGASGILPSALYSLKDRLNLSEDEMIMALFNASAIGEIIAKNATVAGAEGGCQAECGVAAAMAASAIVEAAGGSPEMCLDAASFALTNIMGLVCDPIAGLVEYPCAIRNASGVVNAFISADMAIAQVQSIVPFDEVVEAMYKVGKALPESLRETALGGLADTPTGRQCTKKIFG